MIIRCVGRAIELSVGYLARPGLRQGAEQQVQPSGRPKRGSIDGRQGPEETIYKVLGAPGLVTCVQAHANESTGNVDGLAVIPEVLPNSPAIDL
jgi:hypothetical protein